MPEVQLPEHLLSNIERENPWDLGVVEASRNLSIYPEREEIEELVFDELLFPH